MRSDKLHVVCVISNPVRWQSRMRLFYEFAKHMIESGVQLTVVECAFGEIDHLVEDILGVNHVRVHGKTVLWSKENLLNLGIQRLPRDWKYVAWVDADVHFRRKDWAAETVHVLQHYDVVQPWTHAYDLGPHDEHMHVHHSFCYQWIHEPHTCDKMGHHGYRMAHPGYAWAANRHAIESLGGLLETAILGAADHHMALALINKAHVTIKQGLHPNYSKPIMQWQERAHRHVCQNIGYVPGTIEHRWHGAKTGKHGRKYVERWDILKAHRFDPETDLKYNSAGVLELAANKPGLRRDIMAYFRQRNEDLNAMVD